MTNIKKISALAVTALAFIAAPALADDDWDDDDDDYRRPRATQVNQQRTNNASHTQISRERAVAIAQNHYKGARVTDVDLERKRGQLVYQIDLKKRPYDYEVWVDAHSGKIIHSRKELDD